MTKLLALLMTIAAVSFTADAQTVAARQEPKSEVALTYTYLRTNAPVDQCGCFSPNGGSASFALPLSWHDPEGHLFLVGDVTAAHAGGIAKGNYDLTLSTFTAGLRYRPRNTRSLRPYAQVLAGGAHASGSLVSGKTPAAYDSALVFASNVGGGLDLNPHPESRFTFRLIEADYLVTLVHNGINDHQNILRLSTGIVFRFGRN